MARDVDAVTAEHFLEAVQQDTVGDSAQLGRLDIALAIVVRLYDQYLGLVERGGDCGASASTSATCCPPRAGF